MKPQQQRQFVRLKSRQKARLKIADRLELDCVILDFSVTGLSVQISRQEAGAPHEFEQQPGGTPVTVVFPGTGTYAGQSFQMEGNIAHSAYPMLGINTKYLDNDAFLSMLEYRAGLYRAGGDVLPKDLDPVDAHTIHLQCLSIYRPFLSQLMREFVVLAKARAEKETQAESGQGEAARNLAALSAVEDHKTEIYKNLTRAGLNRAEQGSSVKNHAAEDTGVSLMEEDEVEDWLNLSSIISKLNTELKQHLGYFERLYFLLNSADSNAGVGEIFFQYNLGQISPFSPDALCRAFQEALKDLHLDLSQRAYLYRLFAQIIAAHGAPFYESLTKLAIVAEPQLAKAAAQQRNQMRDAADFHPAAHAPMGVVDPAQGMVPASAEAKGYSLDRTLAALNASGLIAPAQATSTTGLAGQVFTGGAPPEGSLIGAASQLQQVLSNLTLQLPGYQPPYALPSRDNRPELPEASTNEVLLALDSLLRSRQEPRPESWQPSLTEQLRTRLAQAGGSDLRIAPQQQQILDGLANMFDRMMGEYAPASEIESLLKRFEAPVFKMALKDPDFLTSEDHPARRVINIVDQFAIATDDSGKFFDPNMPKVLGAMVDNIITKADLEPDVYGKAISVLEKMLQPLQKVRRQRISSLQEASEGKHRILQSRLRVLTELEARLGGRRVPRILLRLLDGGWRQYLGMLEMRQGMQGGSWMGGLEAIDRIQTMLAPGFTPGKGYDVEIADLMYQLNMGLATVSIESHQTETLLKELDRLLLSRLDEPQPKVDHVQLERGRILRGQDDEADQPYEDRLHEQLVLGWWWNIIPEGEKPTPMQLIWLSEPVGSCAFANRSATKKHEFSLAQLFRMKEAGTAKLATDKEMPLLERSESALVDVVYQHLSYQSTHDPVTNLINRKTLLLRMAQMASQTDRENQPQTLAVMEFDQLRVIAHQHGMETREALLRELAAEVGKHLRKGDVLAALGEDGFAAYMPDTNLEEGRRIMVDILAWLKGYRLIRGEDSFSIGTSVGLAAFNQGVLSAEEALRHADAACMRAKDLGRNQLQIYRSEDIEIQGQMHLMEWAGRIDKILDRDGLYLRCQMVCPINGRTDVPPYYEILLGVRGPDGRDVETQPFVKAVERWNRAHDMDRWVVESTFRWIRGHQDVFAALGGFSVNLSAHSLNNEELLGFLQQQLSRKDIPAEKIMFEITETGTISSYGAAHNFIQQIRRHGCKFCIDDFGSGYASYGHLKNLQTDTLKIDGIFVKDMLQNPADIAMVRSMNEIGHSLGMKVVAEFVATDEILQAVREIGVDYAQGYALHKPMPIDNLIAVVRGDNA